MKGFYQDLAQMQKMRDAGLSFDSKEMKYLLDIQEQISHIQDFIVCSMQGLNEAWIAERKQLELLNRIEHLEKELERIKKSRVNAKYFAPSDH